MKKHNRNKVFLLFHNILVLKRTIFKIHIAHSYLKNKQNVRMQASLKNSLKKDTSNIVDINILGV